MIHYIIDFIIGFGVGIITSSAFGKKKCQHKWKTVKETRVTLHGLQIGYRYTQQCEHCGELKVFDTTEN
jgi:hypothetical protein